MCRAVCCDHVINDNLKLPWECTGGRLGMDIGDCREHFSASNRQAFTDIFRRDMCEIRVSGLDRLAVDFANLRSDESARQLKGRWNMWLLSAIGGVSDGEWLPKTPVGSLV